MNKLRFIVALLAGVTVTSISLVVAWENTRGAPLMCYEQWSTQDMINNLNEAAFSFKEDNQRWPVALSELNTTNYPKVGMSFYVNTNGVDGWKRPFQYQAATDTVTIKSLGRDGRIGGEGLDCDLMPTDRGHRNSQGYPTFHQFFFDCPSDSIVMTCYASGIVAFLILWRPLANQEERYRPRTILFFKTPFFLEAVITIIGALVIGTFLAILHVPSGH